MLVSEFGTDPVFIAPEEEGKALARRLVQAKGVANLIDIGVENIGAYDDGISNGHRFDRSRQLPGVIARLQTIPDFQEQLNNVIVCAYAVRNWSMVEPRPFNGRVIFDHLPKTGGLAIRAWLERSLGAASIAPHQIGYHQKLIRRYGGDYPVIAAHIEFCGEGLDPRYQYLACVREPLDRAISWLFFVKTHDERLSPLLLPLREKVNRFITSEGDDLEPDLVGYIGNSYAEHFSSILAEACVSDAEKLSTALSATRQYEVCGLYEDFPAFIGNVAALIGLPAPNDLERVNVTLVRPTAATISPPLRKRLEDLNALDIELYDKLRERWANKQRHPPIATLPRTSPWLPYNASHRERMYSISDFTLVSAGLEGKDAVSRGQSLLFAVEFSLAEPIPELEIGIHIFDEDGRWAFGTNTTLLKQPLLRIRAGTHRVQYCVIAELPEGKYTAGFAFAERRPEGHRQLAWYDKLAEFSVVVPRPQACVGYASLPVVGSYRQIGEEVVFLIADATGSLQVDSPFDHVEVGDEFFLPVRIENSSGQTWVSTQRNPLQVSYHWLDQDGDTVLFEGERTPFPVTKVEPNEVVNVLLRVVAPSSPGMYHLLVTPMQEGNCWFNEAASFTPGLLDLLVVSRSACASGELRDQDFEGLSDARAR